MKTKNLLSFILLFVLFSCTNTNVSPLTQKEKDEIKAEITAVSDQWMENNKKMDADAAIQFWSTSSGLRFAENGEFFDNRDSILSFLRGAYLQTLSMEGKWLERDIRPLTNSIALMSGEFQFSLEFKNGNLWQGTNAFTGVFIKENNKWSLIQGHESTKSE